MCKFVLVTGGVLSGIGKGVVTSSIGLLLRSLGLHVTAIKIDPYINIDAGTISPFEHGEVFVLEDGGEVDLDLGCYERFMDIRLGRDNNLTTGKIYNYVIKQERKGAYLGQTVQVVPHITNAIRNWIHRVSEFYDVCVIEMGGTIGDIEQAPFIEALRQMQWDTPDDIFSIHVSLVPTMGQEPKTKPTQASVKQLRTSGLAPNMIVCRSQQSLPFETRKKISSFCQVPIESVVSIQDVSNIYRVPMLLESQGAMKEITKHFGIDIVTTTNYMDQWKYLADKVDKLPQCKPVTIAIVGKYTGLGDSYISVVKALKHAAFELNRHLVIEWIECTELTSNDWETIRHKVDGILVPGGFGDRGIESMISVAQYARTSGKPYLGICLGLQIVVIEYARNVLQLENANSTEFDKDTRYQVVIYMPDVSRTEMGATMRLGLHRTFFVLGTTSISQQLHNNVEWIDERHRHRYEVNPEYIRYFKKYDASLKFVGFDRDGNRAEIVELCQTEHPFFVGVQFHPEFKTAPMRPSKYFVGFLRAACNLLYN